MTVLDLDVVTRDVSAGALGLLLDAPAPPSLAELRLTAPHGGSLLLAVLGASHVVTATAPGGWRTEQVSCDAVAAGGRALPPRADEPGYTFTATTRTVPTRELDAEAGRLRAAAADPGWLCAAFPGDRCALTTLTGRATADGWTWQTWHLYPGAEAGSIVTTTSSWAPA